MVPFLVYLLAALTTLHQLLFLARRSWVGYVWPPTATLAGIGALFLLGAAFGCVYRLRQALVSASGGLLAIWTFAGPTYTAYLRAHAASFDLQDGLVLLPAMFLLLATAYTVLASSWWLQSRPSTWYVPFSSTTATKVASGFIGVWSMLLCCVGRLYG